MSVAGEIAGVSCAAGDLVHGLGCGAVALDALVNMLCFGLAGRCPASCEGTGHRARIEKAES